jgi:predicted RNase H-like HicB family nuclease
MEAAEYLKRPYGRLLLPDPDQGYAAEIVEFPGCVAIGETPTEALSNLEDVAVEWIQACLEQGQDIPEPFEDARYSGRTVVRMGHSLHRRSAYFAERDGISLNSFIVNALSEYVGMRSARAQYQANTSSAAIIITIPVGYPGSSSVTHLGGQLLGEATTNNQLYLYANTLRERAHARG